jgi:flagellar assembly protein FliH
MSSTNGVVVELPLRVGDVGVLGARDEQDEVIDLRGQIDPHLYAQLRKQILREVGEEIRQECLRQIREDNEADLQARRNALEQELAASRQGVDAARQAVEAAAAELTQLQHDLQVEAQSQLPSLIADLTRRILGRAIDAGDYDIDQIVKDALKELPPRGQIVVRMNPDDHARSELATRGANQGAAAVVQFLSDPNVGAGGCVVESGEGRVDASIDASVDEIERTVRDSMESA